MITTKILKEYQFKELSDYFNYIVGSQINGNFKQVKDLYKALSKLQKERFYNHLKYYELSFNYSGMF